jgi:predicted CopG family antitoxin
MLTKSIRLPDELVEEAKRMGGERSFTDVVTEALGQWLQAKRREHEDDIIEQALTRRSPEHREEECEIGRVAGGSALRALEKLDG